MAANIPDSRCLRSYLDPFKRLALTKREIIKRTIDVLESESEVDEYWLPIACSPIFHRYLISQKGRIFDIYRGKIKPPVEYKRKKCQILFIDDKSERRRFSLLSLVAFNFMEVPNFVRANWNEYTVLHRNKQRESHDLTGVCFVRRPYKKCDFVPRDVFVARELYHEHNLKPEEIGAYVDFGVETIRRLINNESWIIEQYPVKREVAKWV